MLGILGRTGDLRRDSWLEALGTFVLPAMIGAAIAGLATARLFGGGGSLGWGLAFLGAVVATALGALIGGAIFVEIIEGGALADAIYAPVVVFISLVTPLIGPLWLVIMAATHLVSRRLRMH